ncbi:MAG: hypothetical protein ACHQDB_04975 [Steroidobacterales bacterium]
MDDSVDFDSTKGTKPRSTVRGKKEFISTLNHRLLIVAPAILMNHCSLVSGSLL